MPIPLQLPDDMKAAAPILARWAQQMQTAFDELQRQHKNLLEQVKKLQP